MLATCPYIYSTSSAASTSGVFCAFVWCRTFIWAPHVWCHMSGSVGRDTSARHHGTVEVNGRAWCNPISLRWLADDAVTFQHFRQNLTAGATTELSRIGWKQRSELTYHISTRLLWCQDFTGNQWQCENCRNPHQVGKKPMQNNCLEYRNAPIGHVASHKYPSLYSFSLFALLFPLQTGHRKLRSAEWRLSQTVLLLWILVLWFTRSYGP